MENTGDQMTHPKCAQYNALLLVPYQVIMKLLPLFLCDHLVPLNMVIKCRTRVEEIDSDQKPMRYLVESIITFGPSNTLTSALVGGDVIFNWVLLMGD